MSILFRNTYSFKSNLSFGRPISDIYWKCDLDQNKIKPFSDFSKKSMLNFKLKLHQRCTESALNSNGDLCPDVLQLSAILLQSVYMYHKITRDTCVYGMCRSRVERDI